MIFAHKLQNLVLANCVLGQNRRKMYMNNCHPKVFTRDWKLCTLPSIHCIIAKVISPEDVCF